MECGEYSYGRNERTRKVSIYFRGMNREVKNFIARPKSQRWHLTYLKGLFMAFNSIEIRHLLRIRNFLKGHSVTPRGGSIPYLCYGAEYK